PYLCEVVRPAFISVKARMAAGRVSSLGEDNPLRGTPFEDFFRRFGEPDGGQRFRFGRPTENQQTQPRRQRRQLVTGQGSGFFISADGYAVTNNHVVDKAEQVEVTTDDGKAYSAKVI